jgi:hypothetical protein
MVRKHELLRSMNEISSAVNQFDDDDAAAAAAAAAAATSQEKTILDQDEKEERGDGCGGGMIEDAIAAAFVAFGVRPIEHLVLEVRMMV